MPKEVQYKINIDGTRNIIDVCLNYGSVKKFIHTSSYAVIGNIKNEPATFSKKTH